MPSSRPVLGLDLVRRIVEEGCFGPDDDDAASRELPHRTHVGVELEWLTVDRHDSDRGNGRQTDRDDDEGDRGERLGAARQELDGAGALPGGSALTFEPGGQLELSSPPYAEVASVCRCLSEDAAAVGNVLQDHGLEMIGLGLDPCRDPQVVVDAPRYRAMAAYFGQDGLAGKVMMCCTAAVQVNLDTGRSHEVGRRWRLAHSLGPTLSAAFAHSPFRSGAPTGWPSSRLETWWSIDPSRTAPADRGQSWVDDWLLYALEARVMLIRRTAEDFVPIDRRFSFREWMELGHELGYPTEDDLDYHLTTLFPPVRPRGRLELRYLDALPEPWWRVAVAVTTCLLDDAETADLAARITLPTAGLWREASRHGLAHPALAASARQCFDAALTALDRFEVGTAIADLVAAYVDRYVAQGRSPADERLDEWVESGRLLPGASSLQVQWT